MVQFSRRAARILVILASGRIGPFSFAASFIVCSVVVVVIFAIQYRRVSASGRTRSCFLLIHTGSFFRFGDVICVSRDYAVSDGGRSRPSRDVISIVINDVITSCTTSIAVWCL